MDKREKAIIYGSLIAIVICIVFIAMVIDGLKFSNSGIKLSDQFKQQNERQLLQEKLEKQYQDYDLIKADSTVYLYYKNEPVKRWQYTMQIFFMPTYEIDKNGNQIVSTDTVYFYQEVHLDLTQPENIGIKNNRVYWYSNK